MEGDRGDRGEGGFVVGHAVRNLRAQAHRDELKFSVTHTGGGHAVPGPHAVDGLADRDDRAGRRVPKGHLIVETVAHRAQRGLDTVDPGLGDDLPDELGPRSRLGKQRGAGQLAYGPFGARRDDASPRCHEDLGRSDARGRGVDDAQCAVTKRLHDLLHGVVQ